MCLLALLLPGPPGRLRQRGHPHRQAERARECAVLGHGPAGGRQQALSRRTDPARRWDSHQDVPAIENVS